MTRTTIKNLTELEDFVTEFATTLRGGDVVGLVGDLGAGKTTFVQLLAKRLGVAEAVKSPTFIVMQLFATPAAPDASGIKHLCHVDAYRLKDFTELAGIGFDEYAGTPQCLTVVEWADRVPELHQSDRPGSYKEITFSFGEDDSRILAIE